MEHGLHRDQLCEFIARRSQLLDVIAGTEIITLVMSELTDAECAGAIYARDGREHIVLNMLPMVLLERVHRIVEAHARKLQRPGGHD